MIGGIGLFVLFECCLREKLQLAVCGTSRKQMVLCYQHDEGGEERFAWRGVVSFPIRWKQLGSENPKYWRAFGCNGKEITHTELANALKHKTEFTKTEWMALGFTSDDIPEDVWCCCICIPTPCCLFGCLFGYLRDVFCNTMSSNSDQTLWTTHFIKSGDFYYAPVDPACRDDPLPGPENASDISVPIPAHISVPIPAVPKDGAGMGTDMSEDGAGMGTDMSDEKDGAGMGTDMSDGTGACL